MFNDPRELLMPDSINFPDSRPYDIKIIDNYLCQKLKEIETSISFFKDRGSHRVTLLSNSEARYDPLIADAINLFEDQYIEYVDIRQKIIFCLNLLR